MAISVSMVSDLGREPIFKIGVYKYTAQIGSNVTMCTKTINKQKNIFDGWLCPGLLDISLVGMFGYELMCIGIVLY